MSGPDHLIPIKLNPNNRLNIQLQTFDPAIPTLYFLDNNIVSQIKNHVKRVKAGRPPEEPRRKFLDILRLVDLEHNAISYAMTLIEKASNINKPWSRESFSAEIRADVGGLTEFFDHARIYEPLEKLLQDAQPLLGNHVEDDAPLCHDLLMYANSKNPAKIEKRDRLKTAEEWCLKAKELGIGKCQLVLVILLACLYGCKEAQNVVKFKVDPAKFNSSSALGDIQSALRVAHFNVVLEQPRHGFERTHYFTDDEGHARLSTFFSIHSVDHSFQTGITKIEYKFECLFWALFSDDGRIKDKSCEAELNELGRFLGLKFEH